MHYFPFHLHCLTLTLITPAQNSLSLPLLLSLSLAVSPCSPASTWQISKGLKANVLLLAPSTLLANWQQEFCKWLPRGQVRRERGYWGVLASPGMEHG